MERPDLTVDEKVGIFRLQNLMIDRPASFVEYVSGGCQINLSIAIDFTGSNGNPSSSNSLHYINSDKNQYIDAIKSVGEILQYYDDDKKFCCYGYGASTMHCKVSHCFALNGNIFDPEIQGIDGVLDAYKHFLKNSTFSGPTNFEHVL